MACEPLDLDLIRMRLSEAREAYHALMTGTKARVIVDQNGERVEFTSTSKDNLYAYIQELEALLCPSTKGNASRGPMRFLF